jgi:hypothetical protein
VRGRAGEVDGGDVGVVADGPGSRRTGGPHIEQGGVLGPGGISRSQTSTVVPAICSWEGRTAMYCSRKAGIISV